MFSCKIVETVKQSVEYYDNCPISVVAVAFSSSLSLEPEVCVSIKVFSFLLHTALIYTDTHTWELLAESSRMRGNALQFAVSNQMIRNRVILLVTHSAVQTVSRMEAALSLSHAYALCPSMSKSWWYKTVKQFGALLDTCRCCCYCCVCLLLCCCVARQTRWHT